MPVNELRRMAVKMDQHIQQLAAQGINDPHVIIDRMVGYLPDLHKIWVETSSDQLRALCDEFPGFYRYALAMEDASQAERERPSRPYDEMVEFSEMHKQLAAQLLATAATLERAYQAMGGGGKVHVVELPVNELAQMHRQWLADLERFKISLRTQGVQPKVLEMVNEGYERLAKRTEAISTGTSTR